MVAIAPTPAITARFAIDSAALLKTVQLAALLPTRHPVVPVLENLHLELVPPKTKYSTAYGLRISSSDLENHFTARVLPVEVGNMQHIATPAAICVPGTQLASLLKNLPTQPLSIAFGESEAKGWPALQVRAALECSLLPGATGQASYELAGEAGNEFPANVHLGLTSHIIYVQASALLDGLAATLPVVNTDELRPAMCGVKMEVTPSVLRLVATDGHRLVRFTRREQHTLDTSSGSLACIIPRRAAQLLLKLVTRRERIELTVSGTTLFVKMEAGQLRIRLTDERYPDYENVIPADLPGTLIAHRLELLAGVKRCALFAGRTNHQLALTLGPTEPCQLGAEDLDFQHSATETLPGTYTGEPMRVGLNSRFLLAMLQALPAQNVRLRLSTPGRAVLLESADVAEPELLCLLMPVMLNNYI